MVQTLFRPHPAPLADRVALELLAGVVATLAVATSGVSLEEQPFLVMKPESLGMRVEICLEATLHTLQIQIQTLESAKTWDRDLMVPKDHHLGCLHRHRCVPRRQKATLASVRVLVSHPAATPISASGCRRHDSRCVGTLRARTCPGGPVQPTIYGYNSH